MPHCVTHYLFSFVLEVNKVLCDPWANSCVEYWHFLNFCYSLIAQINSNRGSNKGKTKMKHPPTIKPKKLSMINDLKAFENPWTVDD